MRNELIKVKDFSILNDAYKSNPQSLEAALDVLSDMSGYSKKIAVLGDMLGLDEKEAEFHRNAGKKIDKDKIDMIFTIGNLGLEIGNGAVEAGFEERKVRFYSTHGAERSHCTVKDTQRTFHLDRKVNVTRSIYQVNFKSLVVVIPERCRCSGGNGYPSLLLLFHPVHRSGAIVHFSDFMRQTGIKQNTFRSGRFSRVDMGHNA